MPQTRGGSSKSVGKKAAAKKRTGAKKATPKKATPKKKSVKKATTKKTTSKAESKAKAKAKSKTTAKAKPAAKKLSKAAAKKTTAKKTTTKKATAKKASGKSTKKISAKSTKKLVAKAKSKAKAKAVNKAPKKAVAAPIKRPVTVPPPPPPPPKPKQRVRKKLFEQCKAELLRLENECLELLGRAPAAAAALNVHGDEGDMAHALIERTETYARRDFTEKRLKEVTAALRRMDEGEYGICVETGEEIEDARLLAIPWTQLSLEGAEILERHGKQYASSYMLGQEEFDGRYDPE